MWYTNKKNLDILFKFFVSVIVLFVGGLIYLGWRGGNLVMFQMIEKCGMSDDLMLFRNISTNYSIYDWVKYSLPDGLWLFSYMFLIDAIWTNYKHPMYNAFLWSLPIIAILSELFQFAGVVPGTFDVIDLLCYLLAICSFVILKFI
jgi:hypothetical protein